jgi:hypothetical protein
MKSTNMKKNDPLYQAIELIVCSKAGREIMEAAALRGEPALCNLDELLCAEIGSAYVNTKQGSTVAGSMASDIMRKLGYKRGKGSDCPVGSRIKSATLWTKSD